MLIAKVIDRKGRELFAEVKKVGRVLFDPRPGWVLLSAPLDKIERKREGWERRYYNSYGNYTGFRFQDFRAGCALREHDGCFHQCNHPEHDFAGEEDRPCECRVCPCVAEDIDEDDTTDYSEGEQPVIVIETPNV